MPTNENGAAGTSQPHLSALPVYQQPPCTDFAAVGPGTDLAQLNLSWREADLPERLRTKHVHRLHPYLGKFIPQLVEIFLRKYRPRAVLDPFMGSGTTLVEANVLGIAAYGCDVSAFNCLLAGVKSAVYDLDLLEREVADILGRVAGKESLPHTGGNVPPDASGYLDAWYAPDALRQLRTYCALIPRYRYQKVLQLILSRAARSARLTTHDNLDFPSHPQREPYHCHKHRRLCRPTGNALGFLKRYSRDTLLRLAQFARIRTIAPVQIVHADARHVALPAIDLVLTSPPYVGLIDYHEQHRYAYELLGLPRHDTLEIGAAAKGRSKGAQQIYRQEILEALARAASLLRQGGAMVTVVGDRYGLYRGLAAELGLQEELRLKRHVNRRTGRRAGEFFEDILIWRKD